MQMCAEKGWTTTEYVDNDTSATSRKPRRNYNLMVADINAGVIDAIVCWHPDRLYRQPRELEDLIDLGVPIYSCSGDLDLSNSMGKFVARIVGNVAKAEVERKSERQKAAERQKAVAGKAHGGRRPFGYTKDGQIFEPEAAPLREAFTAVLAGASLHSVAKQWNIAGLTSTAGKAWSGSTVRQVLVNPRYAGLRVYQGEVIGPAEWPALVSEDVWQSTRDLLSQPGRRRAIPTARKNLLTGVALCSECGRTVGSAVKGGQKVYTCKRQGCFAVSRQQSAVDEWVIQHVVQLVSRPDAASILVRGDRPDVAELRDEAAALRTRLDALAIEFADGDLTASQLRVATDRIKARLAGIESRMGDANASRVFQGLIGAADPRAVFDASTLDRRRAVVEALMTVTVHPIGRGGAFDPSKVAIKFKSAEQSTSDVL